MNLIGKYTNDMSKKKRSAKLVASLSIVFFTVVSHNLTVHAYVRPNFKNEIESNDTQETAQEIQKNNEIGKVVAQDDFSGRYGTTGKTNSSDDDWYRVVLTEGDQYLTVSNFVGNSTYCELLDSENNIIIPKQYSSGYDATKFHADNGIYYVHIVGTTESDSQYTVYVGTPTYSADDCTVKFGTVSTSGGAIKRTFSLADEAQLPKDAVISKINVSLNSKFKNAVITNSSYPGSLTITALDGWGTDNIGTLGLNLKSAWGITIQPNTSTTFQPIVHFYYVYPEYGEVTYPRNPIVNK